MGQQVESLPSSRKGKSLSKAIKKAVSIFRPESKNKRVKVTEDRRGIVISLMTDLLFEPGQAEVNIDEIRSILENLRLLIDSIQFNGALRIEGHTDDLPYGGDDFRDNWDLSMQRAWSVLNAMRMIPSLSEFDESKVSIVGFGSTKPLEGNETPEQREYNRRVDIVLVRQGLE